MNSVLRLLERNRALCADAAVLTVAGGPSITHAELHERSVRLAYVLAATGVQAGATVGLHFPQSHWIPFALTYLATVMAGAHAAVASAALTDGELERFVAEAGVGTLVAPGATTSSEAAVSSRSWEDLARLASTVDAWSDGGPAASLADPVEILHSSGTTGMPRAVHHPRSALVRMLERNVATPRTPRTMLVTLPLGSNGAQVLLWTALTEPGTTLLVPSATTVAETVAAINLHRPWGIVLVPTLAAHLVDCGELQVDAIASVRLVTLTGASSSPGLRHRVTAFFHAAALVNAYGLTETWNAGLRMVYDPRRPDALGRPTVGSAVRIADATGGAVPTGTVGEIWLSGDGATRKARGRLEWVATGDLGYVDADGYVYLVGRAKDIVVTGGANVSSLEVEAALERHHAVREAAVVGLLHVTLGEYVAAAVVPRGAVTVEELHEHCRRLLARYKLPRRILLVADLPRNATGKLLKGRVREMLMTAHNGTEGVDVTRVVLAIWSQVLERHVIPGDDFYELGGDSLTAQTIVEEVGDRFGVEISVVDVLDNSEVNAFTAMVAERLHK